MSQGTELPYRWGKFQAWTCLFIAVVQLFMTWTYPLNIITGIVLLYTWYGLWRKRPYGFWLVYVLAVVSVLGGMYALTITQAWDSVGSIALAVGFWSIPAIRYYPQRYGEFAWAAKQQEPTR
jgi:hypothetical protein